MRTALYSLALTLIAAPTMAADLGTYRVGTPYNTTAAPEAGVCDMQCAGDAQCRAWNYVKPGPAAQGICEFLSVSGNQVSSAISISGMGSTGFASRPDVMSGNTNTIRVGTSSVPAARPQVTQRPSGPRIVREAVPQPRPVQGASYQRPAQKQLGLSLEQQRAMIRAQRSGQAAPAERQPQMQQQPLAPQMSRMPAFQPMLDGRATPRQPMPQNPMQPNAMPPRPMMQAPQMPQPQMQQQRQPMMQRGPARTRGARGAQQPRQIPANAPAQAQGRPPIGQAIAPPPIAPAQVPLQAPTPQAPMPRASAANPVSFANAQASLYGNLNDDVRVPASNQPVPQDPNAPLPTAQARPVAPVQMEQLAGARQR